MGRVGDHGQLRLGPVLDSNALHQQTGQVAFARVRIVEAAHSFLGSW